MMFMMFVFVFMLVVATPMSAPLIIVVSGLLL
jgi:hypothetical protein